MKNAKTDTVAAFRKLLTKQSKPQFMATCKTHNVEYIADAPRAPMIDAIVASAFPEPAVETTPKLDVPGLIKKVNTAVAANNVATEPTATAVAAGVPELLVQLRAATSPLVKKRIRRGLRKLGHRGGLGTVDETPTV